MSKLVTSLVGLTDLDLTEGSLNCQWDVIWDKPSRILAPRQSDTWLSCARAANRSYPIGVLTQGIKYQEVTNLQKEGL